MFLVIDGVCRGLGRGQRIKNRPQSNQGFGKSEQQENDEIDLATTATTNNEASAFEDDDEYFAVKKALGIHLILKKILICLNPPNLLQARLVSSVHWFDVATEILIRRHCLRIDFAYSSRIDCFASINNDSIHDCYNYSEEDKFPELYDTLHKLTNCIRKSRKFPCMRFGFSGELNKREVKEFLDVYGSEVKELDLGLVFPLYNTQLNPPLELANILLSQAPNLDRLYIKSVENKPVSANPSLFDSSTSSPVKLPKLKTIILNQGVDRDLNIIQDVITAAVDNPGFKCHFDFPRFFSINHVDLFIQMNKLDSVRELVVSCPHGNHDYEVEHPKMEFYRRFANSHHKLSRVKLYHSIEDLFQHAEGFRDVLPKIFDYSRKTLKSPNMLDWDYQDQNQYLYDQHQFKWHAQDSDMEEGLSDGEKLIQGWGKQKTLLKKILSHLNKSQLLDCRLVNKNWSHEAFSILIERKSIHLNFVFSPQANRFLLSEDQEENVELPLDFFVEDLPTLCNLSPNYRLQSPSPSFPCYKMSIMTRRSIVHSELYRLPSELSELELIFDFGPHTTPEEWKFISDLLRKASHLKALTLTHINNYKSPRSCAILPLENFKHCLDNNCLSIKMLQMNKLECRVTHPHQFTIESYHSLLEESRARSMSIIFEHLEFRPTGKNIQMYQKIAETSPQLRSINIDLSAIYEQGESDISRKVSSILSQILKSSSQTLMEIKGMDQLGFLPGLKLPKFPLVRGETLWWQGEKGLNLRNLKYSKVHLQDFTVSLLPRGCKFSTSFPFLTSLIINYFPDGAEIDKFHPNLDTAHSVKRLTIGQSSSPVTPFIFQKISRMFPELEFLFVTVNVEDFYRVSQNIWTKFPRLKELNILFIIGAELKKEEYFSGLDAAFTGYPENICSIRKGSPPKNPYKKYPSLINLLELKSLQIFFEDFSRPEDPWNYLSNISNRGTFSELPRRRITVEVKACDSRNIQKIENALRWLPSQTRAKVGLNWAADSKFLQLTKPRSK